MFKLRKLNARGVAHHALIMLLIVVAVGGFGAYRVIASHADNIYTYRKPNGCFPGKLPGNQGGCHLYNRIDNVRDDCTTYHLQFDGTECQAHCIAGWYISATTGDCQQLQNPPSGGGTGGGGGSGGGGSGGGGSAANCDSLKRHNGSGGNCGSCYDAFHDATPNTTDDLCIRTCDGPHQFTNQGDNQCHCAAGYSLQSDDTCKIVGSGGGTPGQPNNTTGSTITSTATDNADETNCTGLHRKWHGTTKVCGPECSANFQLSTTTKQCEASTAAAPQVVTDTATCKDVSTPDGNCVKLVNIKKYCDSRNFSLTNNKQNCKLDCVKGYDLQGTVCVKHGTDIATDSPLLNINTSIPHNICTSLGFQWALNAPAVNTTITGCAVNQCSKNGVSVIANSGNSVSYCAGYISKISAAACSRLHRNWVAVVSGCMQNPLPKSPGATLVKQPQCATPYTTYVFRASEDECRKPGTADSLKGFAQSTGHTLGALTHLPAAQLCNQRAHMHWEDGQCVQDKPATITTSTTGTLHYVALGDSLTADPGLDNVVDVGCLRSDHNYPHLVAKILGNVDLQDMSCGGAQSSSMTAAQAWLGGGGENPPQFTPLTSQTDLVTVRIGINDSYLYSLVLTCPQYRDKDVNGSPCQTYENSIGFNVQNILASTTANLNSVLQGIHTRAPNATVVVVGYPSIIPPTGTCNQLPVAKGDYAYMRNAIHGVVQAQRATAAANHAYFIDMEKISAGHDICSKDPWMAGRSNHPGVAAAYHGYPAEMNASANAIVKLVKDLQL